MSRVEFISRHTMIDLAPDYIRDPSPLLSYIDEIKFSDNTHTTSFPTFGVCGVCSGYTEANHKGETITDKALIEKLILIQYGYFLGMWAKGNVINRFLVPHLCECDHVHEWIGYQGSDKQVGRYLSDVVCKHCDFRRVFDSSD